MLAIIHNVLRQIPIFKHLELEKHEAAIRKIQLMYFPAGYVIFKEGDSAQHIYVIKNGEVEIYHAKSGADDEVLAGLTAGDFFGEMALIEGAPRNASARAITDVEAFFLDEAVFRQLARDIPELDEEIVEEYLRRKKANQN
jgi:CRP-like cAMP-binding protein